VVRGDLERALGAGVSKERPRIVVEKEEERLIQRRG
jgi:hypothetical protein